MCVVAGNSVKNKGGRPMIQLNLEALTAANNEELLTSALFTQYQTHITQAVEQLVASRHTPGAWTDWLNLGGQVGAQTVAEVETIAQWAKGKFTDMVVLGIGGSSLGGYALLRALVNPYWNQLPQAQRDGWLRYHFVENVDADQIQALDATLDLKQTLFVVITKSGTTAETMSALIYFRERLMATVGQQAWADHVVAITDPNKGLLRQLVSQWGIRSLSVPADVGGRFSVLSAVGLLPAALCGVPVQRLIDGVNHIMPALTSPVLRTNPAAQGAVIQHAFNQKGFTQSVFMPYSARLAAVADWYVQLWAESLGKAVDLNGKTVHAGQTPIKAVGVTDQHSQVQLFNEGPNDKIITFIEVAQADATVGIPANTLPGLEYLGGKTFNQLMNAEFMATRQALTDAHRPSWTLTLPAITPEVMGALLMMLQVQTALAGALMHIDPFNQPGVEAAKEYTYALMGRAGYAHKLPTGMQVLAAV
jgi:glucose-6-phosphate isomerase